MGQGVVEQVGDDALEAGRVDADRRRGGELRAQCRGGEAGGVAVPPQDRRDRDGQVGWRGARGRRGRHADGQEAVGEGDEPGGVGGGAQGLPQVGGGPGPSQGELELGGEEGERGAKFVAGVADEAPLPLQRGVQGREHVVEGAAEAGELVVAGRDVGADAGGAAGDAGGNDVTNPAFEFDGAFDPNG
ncbi:hypothetical protein ACQP1P_21845 [Dactylosporangium sp. CA-052675]|uniref:hypothetical protein n=1 Tax=Dactylosporangium sp. CA-052675 TaxID=3239927 RepID=UPI003D8EB6E3